MLSAPVLVDPPPSGVALTPAGNEILSGPAAAAWMTRRFPSVWIVSPAVLQICIPVVCSNTLNGSGGQVPALGKPYSPLNMDSKFPTFLRAVET